ALGARGRVLADIEFVGEPRKRLSDPNPDRRRVLAGLEKTLARGEHLDARCKLLLDEREPLDLVVRGPKLTLEELQLRGDDLPAHEDAAREVVAAAREGLASLGFEALEALAKLTDPSGQLVARCRDCLHRIAHASERFRPGARGRWRRPPGIRRRRQERSQ